MTQGLSSNSKSQELYSKITLALEEFKAVKENGEPWGQVTNRDEMVDTLKNAKDKEGRFFAPRIAYNKPQLFIEIFNEANGNEISDILKIASITRDNTTVAHWLADRAEGTLLKGFSKMDPEQQFEALCLKEKGKDVSVSGWLFKKDKPELFDIEFEKNFFEKLSKEQVEKVLTLEDIEGRRGANYVISRNNPALWDKTTEKLDGSAIERIMNLKDKEGKTVFQDIIDEGNRELTKAATEKLSSEQMLNVVRENKNIMKFVDEDSLAVIGSKLGHADKVEFNSLMNEVKGTGQGQSQAR